MIPFQFDTPIARQAVLAALTAYIEVIDGKRIQPVDNPSAGAPELLPPVVPAPVQEQMPTPESAFQKPLLDLGPVDHTVPPTFPMPLATPTAVDAELDSEGKPWDAELHSATKSKTSDGAWRKKRGAAPPAPPAAPPAAEGPISYKVMMGQLMSIMPSKIQFKRVTEIVQAVCGGAVTLPALGLPENAQHVPTVWAMVQAEVGE